MCNLKPLDNPALHIYIDAMKDRYALKKEKVANLLFDLVKYLLTTVGAIMLLSEKPINPFAVISAICVASAILIAAVLITPAKEDL